MKAKKTGPTRKAANTSKAPASSKPRRSRGRPRANQQTVGRETIVASARKLLDKLPPHKVTISSIARSAGVDPALVRYYFTNREELILAVIEDILATWHFTHPAVATAPAAKLSSLVRDMLDFALNVRSMQRLMIDECASAKSPEVRRRVRDLNAGVVNRYALLLHSEKETRTSNTDPLFMHVAIIGMCEFFAAAQAMIRPLVPADVDDEELAARYKDFIGRLVLDGLRSSVEPWAARTASAS
ncbi:MAG TPA: TetR/AcrR family transcriptional regulator [Steroidobacteraceae bacterium]|nr:TetR/AcrR family transcriptional regulator [Steroidobacteraceae bacterium]